MNRDYAELKRHLGEVVDLRRVSSLLEWDQQTLMPSRAAELRADELGTLDRLAHERFTSPEVGRLLENLAQYEQTLDPESDEASLIRVTRRDWEKARKVPSELRGEMTHSAATALPTWVNARQESDFKSFLPHLERNVELKRRYIACFDGAGSAYDVLLDDFEEGMRTHEVDALFDELKRELRPLIAEAAANPVDDSFLTGDFAVDDQRRLNRLLVEQLGWTLDTWRFDEIVHPAA